MSKPSHSKPKPKSNSRRSASTPKRPTKRTGPRPSTPKLNDAPKRRTRTTAQENAVAQPAVAPKIHKVLAQAGLGSRLEMEALIAQGHVTVNQTPAHVGQRIHPGDAIRIRGRLLKIQTTPPKPRVMLYHKPAGEVVTHDDPQNRPTVFRTLPRLRQGKWLSVGRLDLNTEGLLLLTNSGELANLLMHPRFGLERTYAARVLGALSDTEQHSLLEGVTLEDGPAKFNSLTPAGGEGANCWYHVTISEGRNREVRRMFESLGHAVSRLIRIQYGSIALPRYLRRGQWTELPPPALKDLLAEVGMPEPQREPPPPSQRRKSSPDRGVNKGKRTKPSSHAAHRAPDLPRHSKGRVTTKKQASPKPAGTQKMTRKNTRSR